MHTCAPRHHRSLLVYLVPPLHPKQGRGQWLITRIGHAIATSPHTVPNVLLTLVLCLQVFLPAYAASF